jgi:hypothetical protein
MTVAMRFNARSGYEPHSQADFGILIWVHPSFWRKSDILLFINWLERATQIGIPEMKKFALGLERDRAAVVAALEYEWSNGPTEGHINRLKTLTRMGLR